METNHPHVVALPPSVTHVESKEDVLVEANHFNSNTTPFKASAQHSSRIFVVQQIIAALLLAVNEESVVQALDAALAEFIHVDASRHDNELKLGAPAALYKLFLLAEKEEILDTEMVMHGKFCKCLRYIYMCSPDVAAKAYDTDVGDKLMKIIFPALRECLDNERKYVENGIFEDALGALVTISFAALSKFNHDAEERPFYNDLIVEQKSREMDKDRSSKLNKIWEDILLSIRSFGISGSRASAAVGNAIYEMAKSGDMSELKAVTNEMYYDMFHYPSDATFGYVEYSQVTDILLECVEQHSMKIRELGAQGLWQLSNMPPYNKILAQKYYCRKALTKLLSDKNSNVRANGASALYELSQWKQNKRVLATHFDGLLLDELIRVARDDSNESARYHASNAIKRLISEETVGLVASHVFPHLANGNPRPDEVNRVTALKDYMTEYLKHKRQSMDEEDPINNEPSATIGSLD